MTSCSRCSMSSYNAATLLAGIITADLCNKCANAWTLQCLEGEYLVELHKLEYEERALIALLRSGSAYINDHFNRLMELPALLAKEKKRLAKKAMSFLKDHTQGEDK